MRSKGELRMVLIVVLATNIQVNNLTQLIGQLGTVQRKASKNMQVNNLKLTGVEKGKRMLFYVQEVKPAGHCFNPQ